jgi:aminoglycoside phosphotransferase (APT) family kinase protein
MNREFRVINALGSSAVPVPKTIAYCDDVSVIGAPFYVMEHLNGQIIGSREDALRLTEADRAGLATSMLDTLAALHSIDPLDIGLSDFGRPDGYLERQLRRWRKQWDSAHGVDRPEVAQLIERLGEQLPTTRRTGIVHGDYKVDNLMLDRTDATRVIGLLDWEMSTLGDTLADVGLMLSFWDDQGATWNPLTRGVTAMPGFPTASEMLEGYALRVGLDDMSDVDWYISLADLKVAVIFEQIHVRHEAGQTVGEGFDGFGHMVEPLLRRALDRMRTSKATPRMS